MRSTSPPPDDDGDIAAQARALRTEIERHARAFATIAPSDGFFSHVTAAVLWNLPLPIRLLRTVLHGETPRGIDVSVPTPRRAPKSAGVRGHALLPALTGIVPHAGLRVTSPATTWALLAPLLSVDELIEAGDAIVRIPRKKGMQRGAPSDALASLTQLARCLDAGRREGIGRLRAALPQIRVGSASVGETRVRLACARAGLPEPDLDFDVFDGDGQAIGFTELAYPAWRLLIEYEGDHHRTDRAQWDRDIEKHAACTAAGWETIRLTARHLRESGAPAVQRVRDALIRAGWHP
ncbi:hypothetical protein [Microbacterium sp. No. 7]|uniref:hypothetical protein n=1 Tax=Microbacterium sp. No. 7 TaxID=1714373 RepID=UPI000B10CDF7|nr:hypothetical protein [Microbacterium sp. No. 7]